MSYPNTTPETVLRRPGMEYPAEGQAIDHTVTPVTTSSTTGYTPGSMLSRVMNKANLIMGEYNTTNKFGLDPTKLKPASPKIQQSAMNAVNNSSFNFDAPEVYQAKTFDKDAKFREMYGTNANRKDRRRFERYWDSDQRWEDQDAFEKAEHEKQMQSWDARFNAIKQQSAANHKAWLKDITSKPLVQTPLKTEGLDFNNTQAVQQWLMNNGYKLDKYGDDGDYGSETNDAITTMLNDKNMILSDEERQKFMNLQNAWKNRPIVPSSSTVVSSTQTSSNEDIPFGEKTMQHQGWATKEQIKEKGWIPAQLNAIARDAKAWGNNIYNFYTTLDNKLAKILGTQQPHSINVSKQGGTLIKKHQQGGNMGNDIQTQVKQLVQAVANGDQQAAEQVKQIMQAAEQGDQQALQIAQMILAEIEAIKSAKQGAKLNYIKSLKGQCPDGEEVVYFKKGGQICKACQKKHDKMVAEKGKKLNVIEEFKKGRKTKKC